MQVNVRTLLKTECNLPDSMPYRSARLSRLPIGSLSHPTPLQASRAYSIELAPHLLYCSSAFVSCLASTRLSEYLEFKALEHIAILQKDAGGEVALHKVPSSRDDVFTSTLSLQEKRKLMKFLNFANSHESMGTLGFDCTKERRCNRLYGRHTVFTQIQLTISLERYYKVCYCTISNARFTGLYNSTRNKASLDKLRHLWCFPVVGSDARRRRRDRSGILSFCSSERRDLHSRTRDSGDQSLRRTSSF